jgi:cell wall-associated NlpC family hydrolase
MLVLKKFGFMAFLLVSTNVLSIAQNKERIEPNSKATYKKSTPTEVAQKVVLNPKAPLNVNNLTPTKKADPFTATKTVANTKSIVSADDILKSRMVTKTAPTTVAVKKEEPSMASNMLDWVKDKYSSMIDVMPNQISNVMLYRFIDEWYGVKYRMGGTTKKGVDCSAFVQHLYQYVFGYDILRTACLQFSEAKRIAKDDLKEGDLVFFRVGTSRISHVGVYLRNNFFVHSASSKGVSIANLGNAYWSKYFAGGGRIMQ